jgi:dienelactone hydrolase
MRIADIAYEVEGREMVGMLAVDEYRPGPRPTVLVCHEGPGLEGGVRGRAIRLAAMGCCVFALDYQGGGVMREPRDEAMASLARLMADRSLAVTYGRAGLEQLLAQDQADPTRVAAIGYCFGGTLALELAREGLDLKAIVGFHAGLPAPEQSLTRRITGRVLVCLGADDPFVPDAARAAFEADLTEAEVEGWRVDLYGGVGHSFTNVMVDQLGLPGLAYDARADRWSWHAAVSLLEETIGPLDR